MCSLNVSIINVYIVEKIVLMMRRNSSNQIYLFSILIFLFCYYFDSQVAMLVIMTIISAGITMTGRILTTTNTTESATTEATMMK